jgi:hypothetical protein
VSQYGHSWGDETHHGDYESWAAMRTDSFNEGVFESFIDLDSLVRRTPYTAARRIAQATFAGKGDILPATTMDGLYSAKPQSYSTALVPR